MARQSQSLKKESCQPKYSHLAPTTSLFARKMALSITTYSTPGIVVNAETDQFHNFGG